MRRGIGDGTLVSVHGDGNAPPCAHERKARVASKEAGRSEPKLVKKAARIGGIQTTIIRNLLQHVEETHKCL